VRELKERIFLLFSFVLLTGVTLNQILFVKGLSLTSAIHASLLALVTPDPYYLFCRMVPKRKIDLAKDRRHCMGIGGAVILILMKDVSHTATNIVLGDVLVILNAVSYAFYFVFVKPLMRKYSAIHIIRWVFTIGLLFMLPYGWTSLKTTAWETFQFMHWLTVAFIIICATFLAYLCNIFGVSAIGASATGSYIYTQPVFTAILAIIFTGETLDWLKLLAAVLIFCGVYLANFKTKT
jgi:drug/metabolite transporter (DMT)-like permease